MSDKDLHWKLAKEMFEKEYTPEDRSKARESVYHVLYGPKERERKCPKCGSHDVRHSHDDTYVCRSCGHIFSA